jgi:hypothetical protein
MSTPQVSSEVSFAGGGDTAWLISNWGMDYSGDLRDEATGPGAPAPGTLVRGPPAVQPHATCRNEAPFTVALVSGQVTSQVRQAPDRPERPGSAGVRLESRTWPAAP